MDEGIVVAEVALGLRLRKFFHYLVPPPSVPLVSRGSVVAVPFGRRVETGYVLSVGANTDIDPKKLKPIHDVVEAGAAIDESLFELADFVADYYLSSIGEVLRVALPSSRIKARRIVSLTESGEAALKSPVVDLTDDDQRLLSAVAARPKPTVDAIARLPELRGARKRLRTLEKGGFVAITSEVKRRATVEIDRRVELTKPLDEALDDAAVRRSPIAQRVLQHLASAGTPVSYRVLRKETRAAWGHVTKLVDAGLVTVTETERSRDIDAAGAATQRLSRLTLTDTQQACVDEIETARETGGFAPFLLHGVTGAGKSLVYLAAIEKALAAGRTSLILVPEIGLTPVFARELRGRFGETVAVLHSGLPPGQRYDAWRRVRSGAAKVVFGARSAIFAPVADLGLIIVDEEHDASYKQDDRPHHHARDVAVALASMRSIPIVLGSATPSLESYRNATTGRYRLLELPNRVEGQELPGVEIVDMREEFAREGVPVMLSERLFDELKLRLIDGEQSVLLLNRRGYANFLLCRECGLRSECPNCSVSLSYHKREERLKCHHCGHSTTPRPTCSSCGGRFLNLVGHGTEKIETAVKERLTEARVARLDRDSVRKRNEVEEVLGAFENREIDILVGTQMVAKGHDFPNVTLVGVVSVDGLLSLPDFRATERAFSLLTQVAGRAGRSERAGTVLLQTYHPDNEAIELACTQDYKSFYDREIRLRNLMRYPPTTHLTNLLIRGVNRERVWAEARRIARALRDLVTGDTRVLGPAMAPMERLRGSYRAQVLISSPKRSEMRRFLELAEPTLAAPLRRGLLDIDVDPQDLL